MSSLPSSASKPAGDGAAGTMSPMAAGIGLPLKTGEGVQPVAPGLWLLHGQGQSFVAETSAGLVVVDAGQVGSIPYPRGTQNLHHEIELVAAIGKGGRNIRAADALPLHAGGARLAAGRALHALWGAGAL